MEGMLNAALEEPQYNELMERVEGCGLEVRRRGKLQLGDAGDAGWTLVAVRPKARVDNGQEAP
jgi:hypothetical protein